MHQIQYHVQLVCLLDDTLPKICQTVVLLDAGSIRNLVSYIMCKAHGSHTQSVETSHSLKTSLDRLPTFEPQKCGKAAFLPRLFELAPSFCNDEFAAAFHFFLVHIIDLLQSLLARTGVLSRPPHAIAVHGKDRAMNASFFMARKLNAIHYLIFTTQPPWEDIQEWHIRVTIENKMTRLQGLRVFQI